MRWKLGNTDLLSFSLLSKNVKIRICKTITLPLFLYGRETWSLTLREEHRLRVLSRIFGPKRDEVIGGRRKLHNEKLHSLYSSPSIIRMMKSEWIRWAGHVARLGRRGMRISGRKARRKETRKAKT
jgi:hypothetical protein